MIRALASVERPTASFSPEEQYAAAVAAGLSPREMLANVDARISRVAESIADECQRCGNLDYAERFVLKSAETALALRELRAFVLDKMMNPDPKS